MERLLTIGEFAQRCGLSRSALRFYDQNDLLRPRLVDEESGYRYYAIGQLERARLVRRLRAAEMPVGVLRTYLAGSCEQRRAILEAHLASFRERAAAVETAVGQLRDELQRAAGDGRARSCAIAPAELAGALRQVSFAVADPAVRAELGAVWVETKEDSLRLVATDSYRLAVRDLLPQQIRADGLRGVIDAERARALTAELAAAATLTLRQDEAGTITVDIDGRVVTVGGAGEGFPDYERILEAVPAGHRIALARAEIDRALGSLPLDADHLRLRFTADRLVMEAGDRQASLAGRWSGPALTMWVDPRFLADAVSATVGPDLVIEACDPLRPITLRSADTGTFSVLTMPIRPTDPD